MQFLKMFSSHFLRFWSWKRLWACESEVQSGVWTASFHRTSSEWLCSVGLEDLDFISLIHSTLSVSQLEIILNSLCWYQFDTTFLHLKWARWIEVVFFFLRINRCEWLRRGKFDSFLSFYLIIFFVIVL